MCQNEWMIEGSKNGLTEHCLLISANYITPLIIIIPWSNEWRKINERNMSVEKRGRGIHIEINTKMCLWRCGFCDGNIEMAFDTTMFGQWLWCHVYTGTVPNRNYES